MRPSDWSFAPRARTLYVARGFWQRLGGLLVRRPLRNDEALLLRPCSSVHTMFMGYAIDVVFVDAQGRVLKVVERLGPWRMAWCLRARSVLELRAGQAQAQGFRPGVVVSWTSRPAASRPGNVSSAPGRGGAVR